MDKIDSLRSSLGNPFAKPIINDLINYRKQLTEDVKAMDYLKINKNLSEETIKVFCLGYDYYRDNIVIPETKNREFVNIAYRSLDPDAKVKYFKEKGAENWIFNEKALEVAKVNQSILICSNQFDAMSAWQAGFKSVVSVPVGKDAVGMWMELFDSIPRIYIAFENNPKSKKMAMEFADRIGSDKCSEIELPEDVKDLNDYFKRFNSDDFKKLIKDARPYYKYTYSGLGDLIASMREEKGEFFRLKCIPYIEWELNRSVTAVLSGVTNIGKTSIALNIANELITDYKVPVLVLPIERGIQTAGKRFLQVRLNKTTEQLRQTTPEEWDRVIPDLIDLPIYFATPKLSTLEETIVKAKKLFNIKFIIIDHLDLLVRKGDPKSYNVELSSTIQQICSIGQEHNVIPIVVHHIKKQEGVGAVPKKPSLNDLKGSGSVKDDPEIVIMLSEPEDGMLEIDVLKNKGAMGSRIYRFNKATGVIGEDVTDTPKLLTAKTQAKLGYENF